MKKSVSATIDDKLIKWLDSELKENSLYRNRSHIIEIALLKMKENGKKSRRTN